MLAVLACYVGGMRRTHAALAALVALSALPACNKEAPPTVEQPKSPDAEARSNPAPALTPAAAPVEAPSGAPAPAPAAASNRVSESQFDLAIAASGTYTAGTDLMGLRATSSTVVGTTMSKKVFALAP